MAFFQSYSPALSFTYALLASLAFPTLVQGYDAVICGQNGYSPSSDANLSCESSFMFLLHSLNEADGGKPVI